MNGGGQPLNNATKTKTIALLYRCSSDSTPLRIHKGICMKHVAPLVAALLARAGAAKPYDGPAPARMNVRSTPLPIMQAFEVWFNDELQTRCTVADVEKGFICRYVGRGATMREERVEGKVEFKRRVRT